MLQAKLEMKPSANGPMATVGATPKSKYGQRRTKFWSQKPWIIEVWIIEVLLYFI